MQISISLFFILIIISSISIANAISWLGKQLAYWGKHHKFFYEWRDLTELQVQLEKEQYSNAVLRTLYEEEQKKFSALQEEHKQLFNLYIAK
jgi:hypothetical protein